MVEARVTTHNKQAVDSTSFGIAGPVNNTPKARMKDGPCAHQTRLQGDVHCGIVQAPAPQMLRGVAKRLNLRVGGGVLAQFTAIAATSDHPTVGQHNDSSDGYIAVTLSQTRLGNSQAHALAIQGCALPLRAGAASVWPGHGSASSERVKPSKRHGTLWLQPPSFEVTELGAVERIEGTNNILADVLQAFPQRTKLRQQGIGFIGRLNAVAPQLSLGSCDCVAVPIEQLFYLQQRFDIAA
jgi:hypothetical protein